VIYTSALMGKIGGREYGLRLFFDEELLRGAAPLIGGSSGSSVTAGSMEGLPCPVSLGSACTAACDALEPSAATLECHNDEQTL